RLPPPHGEREGYLVPLRMADNNMDQRTDINEQPEKEGTDGRSQQKQPGAWTRGVHYPQTRSEELEARACSRYSCSRSRCSRAISRPARRSATSCPTSRRKPTPAPTRARNSWSTRRPRAARPS